MVVFGLIFVMISLAVIALGLSNDRIEVVPLGAGLLIVGLIIITINNKKNDHKSENLGKSDMVTLDTRVKQLEIEVEFLKNKHKYQVICDEYAFFVDSSHQIVYIDHELRCEGLSKEVGEETVSLPLEVIKDRLNIMRMVKRIK